MQIASVVCAGLGAVVSFAAAAWLMFGFNPRDPRYQVVQGGGYTQSKPIGLQTLMIDQGKVAAVALAGATLQFFGFVFGLPHAL